MDKNRLAEETFNYLLIAPVVEIAKLTDEHLILALQEISRRVAELDKKVSQLCLGE